MPVDSEISSNYARRSGAYSPLLFIGILRGLGFPYSATLDTASYFLAWRYNRPMNISWYNHIGPEYYQRLMDSI